MPNDMYYLPKTKSFKLKTHSHCYIYGVPGDVKILPNNIGVYKAQFGAFTSIDCRFGWYNFDVYFTKEELEIIGFETILNNYCKQHNIEIPKDKEFGEDTIWYWQKDEIPKKEHIRWWIQHIEIPKDKYDKIRNGLNLLKECEE